MYPSWPLSSICPVAVKGSVVGMAGGQAVMVGRKAIFKTEIILCAAPSALLCFWKTITILLFSSLQHFHSFSWSFFSTQLIHKLEAICPLVLPQTCYLINASSELETLCLILYCLVFSPSDLLSSRRKPEPEMAEPKGHKDLMEMGTLWGWWSWNNTQHWPWLSRQSCLPSCNNKFPSCNFFGFLPSLLLSVQRTVACL